MVKKITDFDIAINRENVLRLVDCYKDSEIYSEVVEEYGDVLEKAYLKIKPVALLVIGELGEFRDKIRYFQSDDNENGMGIYCIISIGPKMGEWSTQLFNEGDYLKGMLVDAIADDYLFQMSAYLKPYLIEMCLKDNRGVARRLEAPQDAPMDIQKRAWELTKAKELAGIEIKESFMLDPVKSACQVFLLKDNSQVFNVAHNCSTCPNLDCKLRRTGSFEVTVLEDDELKVLSGEAGESLLEILLRDDISINTPCGGKGICGKCKIQVVEGEIPPSKEDIKIFTKEEIEMGYRLACHTYPKLSCAIKVVFQREEFEVLTTIEMPEGSGMRKIIGSPGKVREQRELEDSENSREQRELEGLENSREQRELEKSEKYRKQTIVVKPDDVKYGIAIDIGTTTIAMQLIDLASGNVEEVYTAINSQRSFGADIISRIEASNKGEGKYLRKSLLLDLQKGTEYFFEYIVLKKRELNERITIEKIHIAANATLVHLLMGYSCQTLGVSPFTPVNIDIIKTFYGELFREEEGEYEHHKIPILIFPGISTYVGGDIVAGLYGLGAGKQSAKEQDKVSILIDLGTNGEIAIGNKNKILTTSTAAGPAFEGGNITCGVGSIPGGIYGVTLKDKIPIIRTIGNINPIGVCGTGVVDVVYEMLKEGLIDETGLLGEETFQEGFLLAHTEQGRKIIITQKDIREIQLAKSAIRAGIETLMHYFGVTYGEVENIYIAGGFGYKLDISKAIGIGLLPKEVKAKIKAVGNSALHGVNLSLFDTELEKNLNNIVDISTEIHLGSDKKFNDFYVEYMCFET